MIRYPDNPKASLIHSRAEKQAEEQEEQEKNTAKYACLFPSSSSIISIRVVLVTSVRRLDQLTVMSVTSGVQPAAILAGSVTTNTYPSIEELIVLPRWYPSPDHDDDNTMKAKNTAIKLVL